MASVVAKVYRSQIVESVHRGSWVIVDAQGRIAASQGDPYLKTFFALQPNRFKPFQLWNQEPQTVLALLMQS